MSECDRWVWQLSRYDDRVHAFEHQDPPASFVEAACSHSTPFDLLATGQSGPRCVACMLIVGDHLAEYHRLGVGC